MKKGFSVIVFAVLFTTVFSQSNQTVVDLKQADLHFEQKRYATALPVYLESIKKSSTNGNVFYRIGVSYLNSRSQKSKAAEFLEKAISNSPSFFTKGYAKETDAPIDAYLYLGDAYHVNYDFDKAIESYGKYKEMLTASKTAEDSKFKVADARIEVSAFAKELKETVGLPANFKIPVFARYSEHTGESTSVLSPDRSTLIYTLKIPVNQLRKYEDERYFKPVLPEPEKQEIKISKPSKKNKNEPDTVVNICTIGTSRDGQVVLTYHNEKGEACLYVIRLQGNKWTNPSKLPKTANPKGWEPGESVSSDGRYLYFTSDRSGGYGGKDLYRCEKLPNGEWSLAQNLGADINTAYDEEAPYFHADGVTLYFSSNRYKPGMSYDILATKLEGKNWSKPIMVGYPINSSDQDIFYQVSENKKPVLASAGKEVIEKEEVKPPVEEKKKKGKNKKGEEEEQPSLATENLLLSFEDPKNEPAAMLLGDVMAKNGKLLLPLAATVHVADLQSQQPAGLFFSEREKGNYSFLLPSGKRTAIWYEAPGFLFASENLNLEQNKTYFEKRTAVVLEPIAEDSKTTLNNILFGNEDAVIAAESEMELQKVVALLNEHPGMKIKIMNYIYSPDKSLKRLSGERANAVKAYLEQKGIDKKRIKAKGVREKEAPGTDKKKGPLKAEDLKPVQKLELEITEINNN